MSFFVFFFNYGTLNIASVVVTSPVECQCPCLEIFTLTMLYFTLYKLTIVTFVIKLLSVELLLLLQHFRLVKHKEKVTSC